LRSRHEVIDQRRAQREAAHAVRMPRRHPAREDGAEGVADHHELLAAELDRQESIQRVEDIVGRPRERGSGRAHARQIGIHAAPTARREQRTERGPHLVTRRVGAVQHERGRPRPLDHVVDADSVRVDHLAHGRHG
jgi:hypothetical protein